MRLHSQRQERRIAAELGARLTPNSGATTIAKGDAVDAKFRYEMKTTAKKQVPVDIKVLSKIWREATSTGHLAAVVVTMESAETPVPKDWVVIEKETFSALLRGEV
jgi:hypothetical protein